MARFLRRLLLGLLALTLIAAGGAYLALRGSLPRLDGELAMPGLAAPVAVERDAIGVVTISADTRIDAMRALGYVHAQERGFEMDLMRRSAAGELSALFGEAALPLDRSVRVHRLRARATEVLAQASAEERAVIEAYVEGVESGRADLGTRPFPYLLTRTHAAPWTAEDTVLVVYAMFLDLNRGTETRELGLAALARHLPPTVFERLAHGGTAWDAPILGWPLADPSLPGPETLDLRPLDPGLFGKRAPVATGDLGVGSNNFAVAGSLTAHGGALVANDMHLRLRVPNIWFRARLRWKDSAGEVDLNGVTLPGVPGLVAGGNGHIAWAFTNSYGDWMDWVRVRWIDESAGRYRTAAGEARVVEHAERIDVARAQPETLRVRETEFGPIIARDADGDLALSWTAHRPQAVNLTLLELSTARDVDAALAVAHRAGVPPQNFVVGDRHGRIAWTLIGRVPERAPGIDSRLPLEPEAFRADFVPATRVPVVEPADGRLWSANARMVDGEALALIGDGGYALGARAGQIRDGLRARERFTPSDLLAIQLDDRALFLARWHALLRETLERAQDRAALAPLAAATARWDERASADAVSYRLVRAFRLHVHEALLDGFAGAVRAKDPDFTMPALGQAEGLVWQLLTERPAHLLAPIHRDYDALLEHAATRVVDELGGLPGGLDARRWGERNTAKITHPLSGAVPWLSRWLDMPPDALPGDASMPRVQGPSFGASERFVIAPGREAESLLHMPGGQSGHPLSPFYGAGHAAWVRGEPTPLLPGPTLHVLTLRPGAG